MFKELFKIVLSLASNAELTWEKLAGKEEKGDEFLSRFLYPFIGLIAASAFIGVLFAEESFSIEYALKKTVKASVSSFGGFYLAAYLLNKLWESFFKQKDNLTLCRRFVGYASIPMFTVYIILALMPMQPLLDFVLLRMLVLYLCTGYIVWEGSRSYMKITEDGRIIFTVITAFLIVSAPELINMILFILMPGMRI
ncbi:MAG: YIP1 family protein [Tannerellaceae bacterium]|jgi:hypothetical protein|nr:YIP1 family protein [Tannerellaceae bacterium]